MDSGKVQDVQALVNKLKAGYTGNVRTDVSKTSPLVIKPSHMPGGEAREAYGYKSPMSHPTPESPNYGAVYKK